jgi:nitrate/TMAO reductase-like tetraheme cytochrome c subunit
MKKATLGALIAGAIIGLGISYVAAVLVDVTGQPKFCSSCHTMKPMVESFHESVHGGNNPHGFAVHHCTDCHLPKNSLIGYLFAKGMSGTRDALAQFGLIHMVDFKENFWEMKHYVYDSACLQCHHMVKEPEKAIGMSEESRYAHEEYWKAKNAGEDISCINCHNDYSMANFAHPNLLNRLDKEGE